MKKYCLYKTKEDAEKDAKKTNIFKGEPLIIRGYDGEDFIDGWIYVINDGKYQHKHKNGEIVALTPSGFISEDERRCIFDGENCQIKLVDLY